MARITWSWKKSYRGSLPIREDCDPLNPRQALLWAFTGFALRGAPIPLPVEYWEELSEHVIECLGIPVEETGRGSAKRRRLLEPIGESLGWTSRRKYEPPASVMNRLSAAGRWVTMDEPAKVRKSVAEVLGSLPAADQNAVKDAVLERLGLDKEQELLPDQIPVSKLASHVGLKTAEVINILTSWGIADVKPQSWIDRALALRIAAHIQRAQR